MIKKWLEKINKEKLKVVLALIVFLQPIISLDYLAYDFLNQFNLPRIATVVHFLIIPLCILIGFLVFEHNRIRAFVLSFVYGFVVLVYFYFHTKNILNLLIRSPRDIIWTINQIVCEWFINKANSLTKHEISKCST